MSDPTAGTLERFGAVPERDFYLLQQELLWADLPPLPKLVLIDLLHRQLRKETPPSATARAELFKVDRKRIFEAEADLVNAGYLLTHNRPGQPKVYLATFPAVNMAHKDRGEFLEKFAVEVAKITGPKTGPVAAKGEENGSGLARQSQNGTGSNGAGGPKTGPLPGDRSQNGTTTAPTGPKTGPLPGFEPGSRGSEVPPDPLLASYPPPFTQTKILAISHDTPPPVGAHGENPDPLAPPVPGKPITDPNEAETEALRLYREQFEPELWHYHGTDPSDKAVQGYRNALEGFLRRGIRPTRAHLAEAVTRACASWQTLNRAYRPRDHGPVVSELAALVNPMPALEKTNGNPRPERNSDRGPGGNRPSSGASGASDPALAAKISRWRKGGRRPGEAGSADLGAPPGDGAAGDGDLL